MTNNTEYSREELSQLLCALAALPARQESFTALAVLRSAPQLSAEAFHAVAYSALASRDPITRVELDRAGWVVQARTRGHRVRIKFMRRTELPSGCTAQT